MAGDEVVFLPAIVAKESNHRQYKNAEDKTVEDLSFFPFGAVVMGL
jgi:hypothetical protein